MQSVIWWKRFCWHSTDARITRFPLAVEQGNHFPPPSAGAWEMTWGKQQVLDWTTVKCKASSIFKTQSDIFYFCKMMGFSHICVQERLLPQAHKYWNLSKHKAWPRTAECVCFTLQQDQNSRFYRSLRHHFFDENRLFPSVLSLSSEREEHRVSCCTCLRSIPLHFLVHISSAKGKTSCQQKPTQMLCSLLHCQSQMLNFPLSGHLFS